MNENIGQRIAIIRNHMKESQEELAEALGVKRQLISYWENGERSIRTEMLAAIAKRYNVSADYLLGLVLTPKSIVPDDDKLDSDITIALYKEVCAMKKAIADAQKVLDAVG